MRESNTVVTAYTLYRHNSIALTHRYVYMYAPQGLE